LSHVPMEFPMDYSSRPEDVLRPDAPAYVLQREDWTACGLFGFNSRDSRSRPFNLLRSQVLKLMGANNWKILGVTSATPGVGKSFIAANLAAAISRISTLDTLLFDLDLRRHTIRRMFEIEGENGIENYLSGETDTMVDMSYRVVDTRLTIYPCFTTPPSSAELIAAPRFDALIDSVRALPQDLIAVCDLPPAFANDDAAMVVQKIDAYLMVVEEGKTTARQIRDAIGLMDPAPCLGTVLNRYHGEFGTADYGFGFGSERKYSAYYS
jgi:protein-tyrosine kinase